MERAGFLAPRKIRRWTICVAASHDRHSRCARAPVVVRGAERHERNVIPLWSGQLLSQGVVDHTESWPQAARWGKDLRWGRKKGLCWWWGSVFTKGGKDPPSSRRGIGAASGGFEPAVLRQAMHPIGS